MEWLGNINLSFKKCVHYVNILQWTGLADEIEDHNLLYIMYIFSHSIYTKYRVCNEGEGNVQGVKHIFTFLSCNASYTFSQNKPTIDSTLHLIYIYLYCRRPKVSISGQLVLCLCWSTPQNASLMLLKGRTAKSTGKFMLSFASLSRDCNASSNPIGTKNKFSKFGCNANFLIHNPTSLIYF